MEYGGQQEHLHPSTPPLLEQQLVAIDLVLPLGTGAFPDLGESLNVLSSHLLPIPIHTHFIVVLCSFNMDHDSGLSVQRRLWSDEVSWLVQVVICQMLSRKSGTCTYNMPSSPNRRMQKMTFKDKGLENIPHIAVTVVTLCMT